MYRKKILLFIVLLLMLTGCTKLGDNVDSIVDETLKSSQKVNTVSTGYEFYLPVNVIQSVNSDYNQTFRIKNENIYLYVDIISYYYKNSLNFPSDNKEFNYYFKKINNDDKIGYIGINKVDDVYYTKIVYNYAKIEFYAKEEDFRVVFANSLVIINSVKFNDSLIKLTLVQENTSGKEFTYELDSPNESSGSFSDYLHEYVIEDDEPEKVELPDAE